MLIVLLWLLILNDRYHKKPGRKARDILLIVLLWLLFLKHYMLLIVLLWLLFL